MFTETLIHFLYFGYSQKQCIDYNLVFLFGMIVSILDAIFVDADTNF